MRTIRVKTLFPIICFAAGVVSLAFFRPRSSKSETYESASSHRDAYERILRTSSDLPEVNTPVCRMTSASTHEKDCRGNQSLPELIFVAGIEGSGHHLISVFFDSLAKKSDQNLTTWWSIHRC